jgi:hypothetical protein
MVILILILRVNLRYHLVREVCDVIKQHTPDPRVLAASVTCLTLILYEDTMCTKYIRQIADQLGNVTPLLQYLGGKKYASLYHRAAPDDVAKTPGLANLSNPIMHEVS